MLPESPFVHKRHPSAFSLHPDPDSRRLFLQLNNHKIFRHSKLLQSSHSGVKFVINISRQLNIELVYKEMSTVSLMLFRLVVIL